MSSTDIYNTLLSIVIIAVFSYGVFSSLHKIKSLEKKKWFKYINSFGPPVIGSALAAWAPLFFPTDMQISTKIILGSVACFNMGLIIGLVRRYIKTAQTSKEHGLSTMIDSASSLMRNPVDNYGKTLAPGKEEKN